MAGRLALTDENWSYGSYPRISYKTSMLYTFYQYKDFLALYNNGRIEIHDDLMELLYQEKRITAGAYRRYKSQLLAFARRTERYDLWPAERIYGEIHSLRRKFAGESTLEELRSRRMREGAVFPLRGGIDQSARKMELFEERQAFILALCEAELSGLMKKDLEELLARGKQIYLLTGEQPGGLLPGYAALKDCLSGLCIKGYPGREWESLLHNLPDEERFLGLNLEGIKWDEELQRMADEKQAVLLVYGEDGFLHCRNLRTESVIQAVPRGYYARAMTNQMDEDQACVVYVPEHFDIVPYVSLTEKTVISYWQLAKLWEAFGNEIYEMSVDDLYLKYPQYFLNIYESGETCREAAADYPIRLRWESGVHREKFPGSFYKMREKAVREFIDRQRNMKFISSYFDKNLNETAIPWGSARQQEGILVHGIRTSRARNSRVINCGGEAPLRRQFQGEKAPFLILSNFLFFMTPKLISLYNNLRGDRPREQLCIEQCHLDYMLRLEPGGQRVETFPLFRKACIAMKDDGNFLFFHFRLGGGKLSLNGYQLSWSRDDVDSPAADAVGEIKVYTPCRTCGSEKEDPGGFRVFVGSDRVNIVIVQDQVICIREGDVVLPSIGVVVSLDREKGREMLAAIGCRKLEDGYYDCADLELSVLLDAPEQIPPRQWSRVKWAMGGGMSLIRDGQDIYENDDTQEALREEGWLCPLSRQTQETAIHELARHPRTAVGVARNGDMFILVFSGRTMMSAGADYREMGRIARKLFPDVWCMMNVDGGSSSVLGMVAGGSFMELSCPAPSLHSCAGMARRINTVLCLEQ